MTQEEKKVMLYFAATAGRDVLKEYMEAFMGWTSGDLPEPIYRTVAEAKIAYAEDMLKQWKLFNETPDCDAEHKSMAHSVCPKCGGCEAGAESCCQKCECDK